MKKYSLRSLRHALVVLTAGLVIGGLITAHAQNPLIFPTNVYYMSQSAPPGTAAPYSAGGGVPAGALLTLSNVTPTSCTFSWYGMRGWSTVQGSADLVNWVNLTTVEATNYSTATTTANPFGATSASFRVNQNNAYVGVSSCAGCHPDKYNPWTKTLHAGVYNNPAANTNFSLACLTIGYGQPTGFTNPVTTLYYTNTTVGGIPTSITTNIFTNTANAYLQNVGCENCHGPAGWHGAGERDLITPAVSLDPAICGSCHQGSLHPTYQEYTNFNYFGLSNAPMGVLVASTTTTHSIGGHGSSLTCGICHQANTRTAMVKEYYDRRAGKPHPVTLFSATDADAWTAACATCHDPHASNNVAQLRYPITSTNWFAVTPIADPTPVLSTNSNGTITTNAASAMAYNTIFDSFYNPQIQVCGQCHAGGGGQGKTGMRWDGSTYGLITNLVYSTNVTQAGFAPQTTYITNVEVFTNISYGYIYTNGVSVGVITTNITTNSYVIPYVTNQIWMASVTNMATNSTLTAGAYYPLIAFTNGTVQFSTNSAGDSTPHYPVQYNVLIGQLDYDLAARGGPTNVLTDAHTQSPNQCADCHVPTYVAAGTTNVVTGHKFVCDYNSPTCLQCHAPMTSNTLAADTLNFKTSVSNSMLRVVSLLQQWGTKVAPPILATNYGPLSWEFPSIGKLSAAVGQFKTGPPSAYKPALGSVPSGTNDNLQLKYVPQDIRMIRFSLYVLYYDQSYGVHNPTYTSNLLGWAENDLITNEFAAWPATFTAGPLAGSLAGNGGSLTVNFTNSNASANWTFGDGGTATGPNPIHPYTIQGLYSVTCTVNGQSLTRTNFILVQP